MSASGSFRNSDTLDLSQKWPGGSACFPPTTRLIPSFNVQSLCRYPSVVCLSGYGRQNPCDLVGGDCCANANVVVLSALPSPKRVVSALYYERLLQVTYVSLRLYVISINVGTTGTPNITSVSCRQRMYPCDCPYPSM